MKYGIISSASSTFMNGNDIKIAENEKLLGNQEYEKGRFLEALKHYRKAEAICPSNPIFISNQSAVFFECGLYQICVDYCERAVALVIGEDPTKLAQRLNVRKAKCLCLLGKLNETLDFINITCITSPDMENLKNSIVRHKEHLERCQAENQPMAVGASIPIIRASIQDVKQPHLSQISNDHPISIITPTWSSDRANQNKRYNLLFCNNFDPRHLLETLQHLESQRNKLFESNPVVTFHISESDEKILARQILILFVLAHPDLNENPASRVLASGFVYSFWISCNMIPPHITMLGQTLDELCKLSFNLETWKLDKRTGWIEFADERYLKSVRDCWIMWGMALEDDNVLQQELVDHVSLIKAKSKVPAQKLNAVGTISTYLSSNSKRCVQEAEFFKTHHMILPPVNLLEGDDTVPPKSMGSWMLNPSFSISKDHARVKNPKWAIPHGRPDGIWHDNHPIHAKIVESMALTAKKSPATAKVKLSDIQPGVVTTSMIQICRLSEVIFNWVSSYQLKLRAWKCELADFTDIGTAAGTAISSQNLKFDRIHTGTTVDIFGLLYVFSNSKFLLSDVHDAAFLTSVSAVTAAANKNAKQWSETALCLPTHRFLHKILLTEIQSSFEEGFILWKCSSLPITQSVVPEDSTPVSIERLEKFGSSATEIKSWIYDLFVHIVFPPTLSSNDELGCITNPVCLNLQGFVKLLSLLIDHGIPKHIIISSLETILGGSIMSKVVEESKEKMASRRVQLFDTTPFLVELKTLLSLYNGISLNHCVINLPDPLYDINQCSWYQAANLSLPIYAPLQTYSSNPAIQLVVINNKYKSSGQLVVDDFMKCLDRKTFKKLYELHSKQLTIISTLYWTSLGKDFSSYSTDIGLWIPQQQMCNWQPPSNFSVLVFRADSFLCAGVSSLTAFSSIQ